MAKKMKNVLLMALSLVLVAALAISGTVAYLTSEDSDVNVMTLGNVKIEQNEQQRKEANGEFSAELENFKQGKPLYPYTNREGTADNLVFEYNDTTFTFPVTDKVNNYIDKIVTVTNTGKSDAFVRTLIALPTGGKDWADVTAASDMWLHWNTLGKDSTGKYVGDDYWNSLYTNEALKTPTKITVDGIEYEVWEFVHKEALNPGETTLPTMMGTYMDKRVNNDDNGFFMDLNSNGVYDDGDRRIEGVTPGEEVSVLVLSQAVQTAGFETAQIALDTAFGDVTAENAVVWFGEGADAKFAATAAELKDALNSAKPGDIVFLTADVADIGNLSVKSGVTFNGMGNTISGNSALTMAGTGEVTVENVEFKDIKNDAYKLSAVYCYPNDGEAKVIRDCTFDTVAWDAIQIAPPATSAGKTLKVVITDNTFKGDCYRYIHVESSVNEGEIPCIDLTITGNKMYTTDGTAANIGLFGVLSEGSTFNISNNYVKDWTKFFMRLNGLSDHGHGVISSFATDDTFTGIVVPKAVVVSTNASQSSLGAYYLTEAEANAACPDGKQVIKINQ